MRIFVSVCHGVIFMWLKESAVITYILRRILQLLFLGWAIKISNTMADDTKKYCGVNFSWASGLAGFKNFSFLTYFHLLLLLKLTVNYPSASSDISLVFSSPFNFSLTSACPVQRLSVIMICFLFPLFISKWCIKCAIHRCIFCIFPVPFVLLLKGSVSRNMTDRGDRSTHCY